MASIRKTLCGENATQSALGVRLGTTKYCVVPRQSHLSATHRDTGNPYRYRLIVQARASHDERRACVVCACVVWACACAHMGARRARSSSPWPHATNHGTPRSQSAPAPAPAPAREKGHRATGIRCVLSPRQSCQRHTRTVTATLMRERPVTFWHGCAAAGRAGWPLSPRPNRVPSSQASLLDTAVRKITVACLLRGGREVSIKKVNRLCERTSPLPSPSISSCESQVWADFSPLSLMPWLLGCS